MSVQELERIVRRVGVTRTRAALGGTKAAFESARKGLRAIAKHEARILRELASVRPMTIAELQLLVERVGGAKSLGASAGCSVTTVLAWLSGARRIPYHMIERLRAAPQDLFQACPDTVRIPLGQLVHVPGTQVRPSLGQGQGIEPMGVEELRECIAYHGGKKPTAKAIGVSWSSIRAYALEHRPPPPSVVLALRASVYGVLTRERPRDGAQTNRKGKHRGARASSMTPAELEKLVGRIGVRRTEELLGVNYYWLDLMRAGRRPVSQWQAKLLRRIGGVRPMSAKEVLQIVGRSGGTLRTARLVGRPDHTVRQWARGTRPVPLDIVARLRALPADRAPRSKAPRVPLRTLVHRPGTRVQAWVGRGQGIEPMGVQELRQCIEALGGPHRAAATIGCGQATMQAYGRGRTSVPPSVVLAIRRACYGVLSRKRPRGRMRESVGPRVPLRDLVHRRGSRIDRFVGHGAGIEPMEFEELRECVDFLGGFRRTSEIIGCASTSVWGYLRKRTTVPPSVVLALRRARYGVLSRRRPRAPRRRSSRDQPVPVRSLMYVPGTKVSRTLGMHQGIEPMDRDELRDLIARLGGLEAATRAIGCVKGRLYQYSTGSPEVPPSIALALRYAVYGVLSRRRPSAEKRQSGRRKKVPLRELVHRPGERIDRARGLNQGIEPMTLDEVLDCVFPLGGAMEVAARIGCGSATIYSYAAGRVQPPPSVVLALRKARYGVLSRKRPAASVRAAEARARRFPGEVVEADLIAFVHRSEAQVLRCLGRDLGVEPMDRAELRECVRHFGTLARTAETIGCSVSALTTYLRGAKPVPPSIVLALRWARYGVLSRKRPRVPGRRRGR